MKKEEIQCSETTAYKIQKPENNTEERIQHSEHGESLNSRTLGLYIIIYIYLGLRATCRTGSVIRTAAS
jgi:hypothetical protein